jgi:hypothetical protein
MSDKKLYYHVKTLSDSEKSQNHILLSTNLTITIENKPYNFNKIFIEGKRDNFCLFVIVNNIKYYFYGIYYPLTNKHVFHWYTDYKSYYTVESPLTNFLSNPTFLVKDDKDPFKFLTINNNNFAHVLKKDTSVNNFINNNIFYFNDDITKKILNDYFMINILLFWIIISIAVSVGLYLGYKKFIKNKNNKIKHNEDYYDDE